MMDAAFLRYLAINSNTWYLFYIFRLPKLAELFCYPFYGSFPGHFPHQLASKCFFDPPFTQGFFGPPPVSFSKYSLLAADFSHFISFSLPAFHPQFWGYGFSGGPPFPFHRPLSARKTCTIKSSSLRKKEKNCKAEAAQKTNHASKKESACEQATAEKGGGEMFPRRGPGPPLAQSEEAEDSSNKKRAFTLK